MNTLSRHATYIKSKRSRDYVILLEELEFAMSKKQLWKITNLHNSGLRLEEISRIVKRDPTEVLLALIHQARDNRIELRPFARRI